MKFHWQKHLINVIDFTSKALLFAVPIFALLYYTYVTFSA